MKSVLETLSPSARKAVERAQATARSSGIVHPVTLGVGGGCLPARRPQQPPNGSGNYTAPPTGRPPCPPQQPCSSSVEVPGCGSRVPICDMKKIGNQKVVQGGQPFFIEVKPDKSPYFDPAAIRVTAVDLANADVAHRVLFTAVSINSFPQEGIHNISPTAPTAVGNELQGWWSDDYTAPEDYAVRVQWGYISDDAQKLVLRLDGIAVGYAGTTNILLGVTLYGNPMQSISMGADMACQPRCNWPT